MSKILDLGIMAAKAAKPHLKTFWYYGKVELAPPKLGEMSEAISGFSNLLKSAKSGAWKNLTVKQAFLNGLVALEICGWFFIGECIGKRHIIGYKLN